MRLAAFDPLRPPADRAVRVASVPYDVVNTEEARALADGNPDSFLRVVRSEVDLPADTDPYSAAVYDRARANLEALQASGALVRHGRRSLFAYRQTMGERQQIGIVGCCHADDYDRDVIKKHEKTRKAKEDDRTNHLMALRAHPGPVFLTIRDDEQINDALARVQDDRPMFDFLAPDGVGHTVWEFDEEDTAALIEAFGGVPLAYVADGHHRSASASRAAAECRAANAGHTGEEEYNWFLSVIFPASQLNILAYNRIVVDRNGMSRDELLAAISEKFGGATESDTAAPSGPGRFMLWLAPKWYEVVIPESMIDRNDPVGSLDAAILEDNLFAPILGIGDIRTDSRIDFVGGIRGTEELERRAGETGVAFSMAPVTIEQLMAIADANRIMPPKSTWFEPKLRSGLLVHTF